MSSTSRALLCRSASKLMGVLRALQFLGLFIYSFTSDSWVLDIRIAKRKTPPLFLILFFGWSCSLGSRQQFLQFISVCPLANRARREVRLHS